MISELQDVALKESLCLKTESREKVVSVAKIEDPDSTEDSISEVENSISSQL